MDLILSRKLDRFDGIFGELRDENDELVAVTLEHAFPGAPGEWKAVIPEGTFTCVRGEHFLHGMTTPFETFEVTGVDGHSGLLFHWGNFNKDSEGCILLGDQIHASAQQPWMVLNSRGTFQQFMDLQAGRAEFQLMVVG